MRPALFLATALASTALAAALVAGCGNPVQDARIVGVQRVSCATGDGIDGLVVSLFRHCPQVGPEPDLAPGLPEFLDYRPTPRTRRPFRVLRTGSGFRVVGTPPECIDAIRHGCKYLIDFAEYGLNYALGGIAARRDYIENNPEITRKFVTAYVEGMHRYRTDREFTIDVQADYSGIADRTIAAETYDLTQPGMPRAPYPVVASLQTLLDFMANELPEAKGVDAQRFVDDRFIRELEDNGFIDSLTR